MDLKKISILHELKDYFFITIGVCLYAFGVTAFMLPYGLTTGGVAGIASIVYYATHIEVQVTYIAINICFLLVAIKVLGWKFCMKTIYAVLMMTFVLWLWQRLIEVPDPAHAGQMMLPQLIGTQSFMAAVLGAIFCGVGLAFCFENNGSTGGTDIIAAIVNKYKQMSLGSVIMACDIVIISSCYFIFHDWARVIFGFVILIICSMTLDYCIHRRHQWVQFMIFSRNYGMIADTITKMGLGVTLLDAEGWWTKTERKVVMCIAQKRQKSFIVRAIQNVDPYAIVSMSETEGALGNAFDQSKVGKPKKEKTRRILVCATNNATKLDTASTELGEAFDVRSLLEVGCDTRQEFNAVILGQEPRKRVSFVKKYFGFDTFYIANDGQITLAEGDFSADEYTYTTFDNLSALKDYLTHK